MSLKQMLARCGAVLLCGIALRAATEQELDYYKTHFRFNAQSNCLAVARFSREIRVPHDRLLD